MKELIEKGRHYKYTSLKYIEYDDIKDSVVSSTDDPIFFYSITERIAKIHWAAESSVDFFYGLNNVIAGILADKKIEKINIEFIPEEFVRMMERVGFKISGEWIDYWNNDLKKLTIQIPDFLTIRKINTNEYKTASEITKSCQGYSRGYYGELPEWFKEWNENDNSEVFVAETNNQLVGICCVSLYGFEEEKRPILWLREIAVKPEYHGKSIGYNLMGRAINWGIDNKAKRSFLACDKENENAIRLYTGMGYFSKSEKGQIDMVLNI